jgi:hypothetical protein
MTQLPKHLNIETNSFEPDFSSINLEKWAIKGYTLNEDNEGYTVELEWISDVPFSITPSQGRMMLLKMGLLSTVKASIEYSKNESLLIFWEYSLSWNRDNIHIAAMAGTLDMTEDQTDDFFIEAKKI